MCPSTVHICETLYSREFEASKYGRRLEKMMPIIREAAAAKWAALGVPYVEEILNIEPRKKCYFVGTLFKDMKLKPNILDEYNAREVRKHRDAR